MTKKPILLQPDQLEECLAELGRDVPPLPSIHGLMTAIAAGPESLPPQQWLGYAFSATGQLPKLDDHPEGEAIVLSLFGLYNDIVAYLEAGEFQPYLGQDQDYEVQSNNLILWCIGFSKGMHFLDKQWFNSEHSDLAAMLVPIYYFIDAPRFETMFLGETATEDDKDDLATQMLLQLPLAVVDIYEYWQKQK